jgi:hypothetical protein
MPFALERLGVFVLAENVFLKLHIGAKEVLEPRHHSLAVLQHLIGDVIRVNVDANRSNNAELFSFDRDRCAFGDSLQDRGYDALLSQSLPDRLQISS